jgi:hypothetical protein
MGDPTLGLVVHRVHDDMVTNCAPQDGQELSGAGLRVLVQRGQHCDEPGPQLPVAEPGCLLDQRGHLPQHHFPSEPLQVVPWGDHRKPPPAAARRARPRLHLRRVARHPGHTSCGIGPYWGTQDGSDRRHPATSNPGPCMIGRCAVPSGDSTHDARSLTQPRPEGIKQPGHREAFQGEHAVVIGAPVQHDPVTLTPDHQMG